MLVRVPDDPPRLLHRRSEHGYTAEPALALAQEPEAVSRATQGRLSEEARVRARSRARGEWEPYRMLLVECLEEASRQPFSYAVRDDLRAIRRGVDRVSSRL